MDTEKINIIKNGMKIIEENIIKNNGTMIEEINKIIELIETIDEKDFDVNILYAKAILWQKDEHYLDDAWWILVNMTEGKNNFEWNYLLAKITFEMKIYDEALEYIKTAIKINGNNTEAEELYNNIIKNKE